MRSVPLSFASPPTDRPDAYDAILAYADALREAGCEEEADLLCLTADPPLFTCDNRNERVRHLNERLNVKPTRLISRKLPTGFTKVRILRQAYVQMVLSDPWGCFYRKASLEMVATDLFEDDIRAQPINHLEIVCHGQDDWKKMSEYLNREWLWKVHKFTFNNLRVPFTDYGRMIKTLPQGIAELHVTGTGIVTPTKKQIDQMRMIYKQMKNTKKISWNGVLYTYGDQ